MTERDMGIHAVRELLGRFSADRDAMLVALDQCRSQLTRLAGRLAMEQARVDEVEQLRAELGRATHLAERATGEVEAVVARLEALPSPDDAIERLEREILQANAAARRTLEEARAHIEVRMDSLAAGFTAQLASVRDGLWDRVAEVQRHLQESERTLGGRTERLDGGLTRTAERLAHVSDELASLRQELEREHARPGPVEWLATEVVAWVGGLAVAAWALGRYLVGTAIRVV